MAHNTTTAQSKLPIITRFKLRMLALASSIYTRRDGTVNHRIQSFIHIRAPASAAKLIGATRVSTSDIHVDRTRNLWFRLFVPSTAAAAADKSLPLIVYFHGGGFASYAPDSNFFDDLCSNFAAKVPAVIASVNYRLTPDHRYPAPYDDGFDALKFIDEQNYVVLPSNCDLNKCFIGGDSAGGNIAHHVTIRALQNAHNVFDKIKIVGVLAFQPFFGGEERTESEIRLTNAPILNVNRTDLMWRNFLPEGADRNHPAAHVFESEGLKALDFPSSLVIVGGDDPLQDWQRRYVEMLRSCGREVELIEYPNAFHGFYSFPEMAEVGMLIEDVKKFVEKRVNSVSS
ncbi:hypothetical protein BUALT_Bualt07G0006700 [Buddleja alternifolia]|uniref:Alpha/beta hydrolase fold-3 domain-containing protein n=1 Tax=Buddleja alternifolia TaxID=168488 RepID=A0AAV6X893_9LAMI|nr:hypothetical protein BUALT_Bualt07G0006700 [Buddleja alternifolia]